MSNIYWEGVKRRWKGVVNKSISPPPSDNGGRGAVPSTSGRFTSGPSGEDDKEWDHVYQKFRDARGRSPYSFRELLDWWSRM